MTSGSFASRKRFAALGLASLVTLFALFATSGCKAAAQATSPTLPPGAAIAKPTPPLALETFDEVWRIIYDHHFDTNFSGVNWLEAKETYRPRVAAAQSNSQVRDIIQEMLDLLKVSHLAIIPSEFSEPSETEESTSSAIEPADEDDSGTPGFEVRAAGTNLLVTTVQKGSPAAKAGVKPGWIVNRIDGKPTREIIEGVAPGLGESRRAFLIWKRTSSRLSGRPGSTVEVEFLNAAHKPVPLDIERILVPGEAIQFGNLPVLYADLQTRELSTGGKSVGYIYFNIWMLPTAIAFNKAIDQFRANDAMVIDLRGNVGGMVGMIIGASGHFFTKPLSLGALVMRDNRLKLPVNPRVVDTSGKRVEPFAGPVAILVDEVSSSASEVFAGGIQQLGRARVFGRTTSGQALPAVHDDLPNGDVLYHPFGDFVTDNGIRFEGRGVIPDEVVPLDRATLLAGKDPALEAALAWIRQQPKNP